MNIIKELRTEAELTQNQFSKLTGIPVRTIQNCEQGVNKPSDWIIELIKERLQHD